MENESALSARARRLINFIKTRGKKLLNHADDYFSSLVFYTGN